MSSTTVTTTAVAMAIPEPRSFETKDAQVIHALRTCGHVPTLIKPMAMEGRSVLMYFFSTAAWTDYDEFSRGVQREPFTTIRAHDDAIREFKNNLRRFNVC